MKHIIVLGDGMADEPIEELGGRTPLQAADTPAMDWLAAHGRCGVLKTVPEGYHPGSEIANLSVLGYDLDRVFEGRGSLEAASMGVDIEPGEMAMRCNLVCIENGLIKNHSAGHISTAEAGELIDFLQRELGGGDANFYRGVSYRHLLKLKGGDKLSAALAGNRFVPASMVPMLRVGEESGTVGEMLAKIASHLENDTKLKIKRLLSLFEPAVIVFLALIVLVVVVSIFVAMMEINSISQGGPAI